MPLTREEMLKASQTPIEELEVPEFGGTVLIVGIPMGHDRLSAYVNSPVLRHVDDDQQEEIPFVKPGDKASSNERRAVETANKIIASALERQYQTPTEREQFERRLAGAFILGVVDETRQPVYGWSDIDFVRNHLNWNGVARAATRIFDLSAGGSLTESKSGDTE
jgi:hypothetical protein